MRLKARSKDKAHYSAVSFIFQLCKSITLTNENSNAKLNEIDNQIRSSLKEVEVSPTDILNGDTQHTCAISVIGQYYCFI